MKKDMEIDYRVVIALDALTSHQKAAIEKLLHDEETFFTHASRPGMSRKLPSSKPLYSMKVGSQGLRIIYSRQGDDIAILDVMKKATMDSFSTRKKHKAQGHSATRQEKSVQIKKV